MILYCGGDDRIETKEGDSTTTTKRGHCWKTVGGGRTDWECGAEGALRVVIAWRIPGRKEGQCHRTAVAGRRATENSAKYYTARVRIRFRPIGTDGRIAVGWRFPTPARRHGLPADCHDRTPRECAGTPLNLIIGSLYSYGPARLHIHHRRTGRATSPSTDRSHAVRIRARPATVPFALSRHR